MIERLYDYPGYLLRFRETEKKPTDRAFLLLHGFPASRGSKNLDLADWLLRHFGRDVYLPHYRGLGESPGPFSFSASIDEATAIARQFAPGPKSLAVIGHSWGGLVATNVTNRVPELVTSLHLLSPFCAFVENDPLEEWMAARIRDELPHLFGKRTEAEIRADLEAVKATCLPMNLAKGLDASIPVAILQSRLDDTTPAVVTRRFAEALPKKPRYRELESDHSFTTGRVELGQALIADIEAVES